MRPLTRLKHNLSFGGTGGFVQPPFWAHEALEDASPLFASVSWNGEREDIENNFVSYVNGAYKANGVVFASILARQLVFSEARFQYQRFESGRPRDLFGGQGLGLLERPAPNQTTGELLGRMEQDGSLAGNFYATVAGRGDRRRLRRLRPDWVTIVSGSNESDVDPFDIDAQVIAYVYTPQAGKNVGKPTILLPEQVVHYSPIPDPDAQWRGMSWMTPIVTEVRGDSAATKHKVKFFENGTTASFVVRYDANLTKDQFDMFVQAYKVAHQGSDNAYKTIHLGGGADITPISANLKDLDFKGLQGSAETRIAAAAGVGAIIGRFSEGLQGSSLNQGNYNAAKRQFADMTIRPLWRMAAAALEKVAEVPDGARLWYDARDVAFLGEDEKDAAEIMQVEATTISVLTNAGYTHDSIKRYVKTKDPDVLEHTGLYSVQLQPPGAVQPPNGRQPVPNGASAA